MSVISRCIARGLPIAVATLASFALPALAGWSADPVTVTSTTATIPIVEGCSDGAYGSFVAWQEGSPSGILRVQHLLPGGDLDPAWPAAGAIACNAVVPRSEVVVLPDRLGGLYLVWKENAGLLATRIDASGAVAPGWPARGRSLGGMFADSPRPSVIEDGAHGFYATWGPSSSTVLAIHLGPANAGAGGWPNAPRPIGTADLTYDSLYWPQIALAPDGGVFVAWGSATSDENASPSAWRLRRLDSAGLNAAGWPAEGLSLGSFDRASLGSPVKGALLALSPDGRGGAFLMNGIVTGTDPFYGAIVEAHLHRLQGNGVSAPGMPADVRLFAQYYYLSGSSADYSYRVFPDGRDGAIFGLPAFFDHGTAFNLNRCDRNGYLDYTFGLGGELRGHEEELESGGGIYAANFYPTAPNGLYQPNAFISIREEFGKSGWSEYHDQGYGAAWYGDIGLAATDDGGAVFFWSQVLDRIGLFARRFNSAGEITAVAPGAATSFSLSRVRFVRGEGVRAAVSVPAGPARFDVFDLAGRRIASQAIEPGAREIAIAGTARLASGLYFGRLVAGRDEVSAKLIVAR